MSFDPGPLADATLQPDGDRWTLVFVRDLHHPPAAVWTALTDPAEIDRWAPFTAARDLAEPGDTVLTMVDGDEKTDLPATVLRSEPPKLLEYTWGDDLLRWELEPTPAGTRLVLRHTPKDPGVEPMLAAGWHLCLVVVEHLLDGRPVGVIRGDDARRYGWEELRAGYARRFAG
jgi:uncharacterized protein YndB with AHSA1/START domain